MPAPSRAFRRPWRAWGASQAVTGGAPGPACGAQWRKLSALPSPAGPCGFRIWGPGFSRWRKSPVLPSQANHCRIQGRGRGIWAFGAGYLKGRRASISIGRTCYRGLDFTSSSRPSAEPSRSAEPAAWSWRQSASRAASQPPRWLPALPLLLHSAIQDSGLRVSISGV